MALNGQDTDGKEKHVLFEILAHEGDGLHIPCIPSVLMVSKLASGEITGIGACPCMGFITLKEHLQTLGGLKIQWRRGTGDIIGLPPCAD